MSARRTQMNFEKAAKRVEDLRRHARKRIPSGLRVIGEEIMTDVKASRPGRGVPVDEGPLRASGRVEGPQGGRVRLTFGGPSAPYALVQHEELDYNHTVGEARYLVRALDRWKPDGSSAMEALKEQMEAALRVAGAV